MTRALLNVWTYNQMIQPTILAIWSIEPPFSNDQDTYEYMNLQPIDPTHYTGNLKLRASTFKWSGHFWMYEPTVYNQMIKPTILAIWSIEPHFQMIKILTNIWTYNQLIQPTILEIWSLEPPLSNDQGTFECMNLHPNDQTHYTGNLKHRASIFKWSGHFWMYEPTTKCSNPQ